MSNNYNEKSRADRVRWIVTVISLVLAAVFSVGLLCAIFVPRDNSTADATVSKDGAVLSETVEDGVSLMSAKIMPTEYAANGVSALADTAYTLTATVEPDYEGEKTFDWSVKFQSDSSSWANGKTVTDYVTVTPTSDGANTATVECKQAFGEKILVTCTSRDYAGLSATCTVDYAQRITGMDVTLEGSRTGNKEIPAGEEVPINFTYYGGTSSYNVYTVRATATYSDVYTLAESATCKVASRSPSLRARARMTAIHTSTTTARAAPWVRTAQPMWMRWRTPSARRSPSTTTCLSRITSAMSRARSSRVRSLRSGIS